MLTDHIKLCAQYGIDVTNMTQVEAYSALVEILFEQQKVTKNLAARLAACLFDFHDTCPECGNDRSRHTHGCAQTYEREFKGYRDTESVFMRAFIAPITEQDGDWKSRPDGGPA